jgi:hypothetical protein
VIFSRGSAKIKVKENKKKIKVIKHHTEPNYKEKEDVEMNKMI